MLNGHEIKPLWIHWVGIYKSSITRESIMEFNAK